MEPLQMPIDHGDSVTHSFGGRVPAAFLRQWLRRPGGSRGVSPDRGTAPPFPESVR